MLPRAPNLVVDPRGVAMNAKTNNRRGRFGQAVARWWAGRTRPVDIGGGWAVLPLRDYPAGRPAAGARRSPSRSARD
jgi:hypothetical protein